MKDKIEIRAYKDFSRRIISLFAVKDFPDGEPLFAQAIDFKSKPSRYEQTPILCNIEDETAQVLMDDLWQCGLRPSEGSGSAGAMAATQKHLEDMRLIVAKKIGVELK